MEPNSDLPRADPVRTRSVASSSFSIRDLFMLTTALAALSAVVGWNLSRSAGNADLKLFEFLPVALGLMRYWVVRTKIRSQLKRVGSLIGCAQCVWIQYVTTTVVTLGFVLGLVNCLGSLPLSSNAIPLLIFVSINTADAIAGRGVARLGQRGILSMDGSFLPWDLARLTYNRHRSHYELSFTRPWLWGVRYAVPDELQPRVEQLIRGEREPSPAESSVQSG